MFFSQRAIAWIFVFTAASLTASAQKPPAADGQAPAARAAAQAPADATEAPKKELPQLSPEEAAQAKKDYQEKLAAWQELLKKLREIKVKYQVADDTEITLLQKNWNDLVAQGNEMIPELRKAALQAFLAAPGEDRALTNFIGKFTEDAWNKENYSAALELCEALLAGGNEEPALYEVAGKAAFGLNQFDKAGEYFQKAKDLNALSPEAAQFADNVEDYKKYWEKEQQIRAQEAQADDLPRVKLTTTQGDIVLELFENEAPNTVANFVSLVEQKFYNGLTFHRVLPHFMAQGGDPNGDGTGGPGYEIPDEHRQENARMHFRGSLSMAKTGAPDSGGSQFFLTFIPTVHLNGKHTVFGRVIEGEEVLDKLRRRDPDKESTIEPDKIISAEVLRKRNHEYTPKKTGE